MSETTETNPTDVINELHGANERLSQALTAIGVELGLSPHESWGTQAVLDKAHELYTRDLHYRALRMGLRMLLERGPMASGTTMTVYGPGDQEVVDKVRHLVETVPIGPTQQPLTWEGWGMAMLPIAQHPTQPAVVLPAGWVVVPEAMVRPTAMPSEG